MYLLVNGIFGFVFLFIIYFLTCFLMDLSPIQYLFKAFVAISTISFMIGLIIQIEKG